MKKHFRTIIAALILVVPASASAQDLERAYKKEFAYLQAQKKALTERLVEIEQKTERKTTTAKAEVDRLQGRLVSLDLKAQRLEEQLAEAERETLRVEEQSDTLYNTVEQARASLEDYEVELAPPPEEGPVEEEQIRTMFSEAAGAIERGSVIRQEQGAFFLADGTQVEGDLVHVGRIATYGISDDASGALAPAGAGRLKLWTANSADASDTAQRLASGEAPSEIGIFLYENLDKPVEEKSGKTVLETIQAGGIIAWVIVGIGILALLLVLARLLILWRAARGTRLLGQVTPLVADGQLEAAFARVKDAPGAVAEVLRTTIDNLGRDHEALEDIVSESILRQAPKIERFGSAIMVFAAVSPLLGLLGTVTGMISTFDVITEYGTGDPKLLSGGISEALITTQLGLIVAIPALLVGNLLNGKASSIIDDMEHAALHTINAAHTEDPEPTDGAGLAVEPEPIELREATG